MSRELKIQEFDDKQVRTVWDDEEQQYYFSVTDVVGVLTEQPDARGATVYWAVLKKRLKQEGANELITNCKQLKLPASDGSWLLILLQKQPLQSFPSSIILKA